MNCSLLQCTTGKKTCLKTFWYNCSRNCDTGDDLFHNNMFHPFTEPTVLPVMQIGDTGHLFIELLYQLWSTWSCTDVHLSEYFMKIVCTFCKDIISQNKHSTKIFRRINMSTKIFCRINMSAKIFSRINMSAKIFCMF